jgi:hypothetical protein
MAGTSEPGGVVTVMTDGNTNVDLAVDIIHFELSGAGGFNAVLDVGSEGQVIHFKYTGGPPFNPMDPDNSAVHLKSTALAEGIELIFKDTADSATLGVSRLQVESARGLDHRLWRHYQGSSHPHLKHQQSSHDDNLLGLCSLECGCYRPSRLPWQIKYYVMSDSTNAPARVMWDCHIQRPEFSAGASTF